MSSENKHLRSCGYFAIIPPYSTMLAKYVMTELILRALLN